MTKTPPTHLRLFAAGDSSTALLNSAPVDHVERVRRAFAEVVGRPRELQTGVMPQPDKTFDAAYETEAEHVVKADVAELTAALEGLVAELSRTQRALREREAELAAGIPVALRPQPQRHFVERLEAVLRAAAEALGCRAAAAYLLDDATTELKLRAAWGLPDDRLLEPARPLRGAKADLEALAGHAVALEDATLFPHWNLPEPAYPAAVCVPIATPTELLGTLWVYAAEKRAFTDHEVNLVEISAGRLAADLEREVLLDASRSQEETRRQWDDAVQHRRVREPQVAPLVDGWEIAGAMHRPDEALGQFYDWLVPVDGVVAAAVGRVEEQGFAAALAAESLRSAWRAHVHHEPDMAKLVERVGADLWSAAVEPTPAHLIGLKMEQDGTVRWAGGGRPAALWLPSDEAVAVRLRSGAACEEFEIWSGTGEPLGLDPDFAPLCGSRRLLIGERILLADDPALLRHVAAWRRARGDEEALPTNCRRWLASLAACLKQFRGQAPTGPLVVVRRTR